MKLYAAAVYTNNFSLHCARYLVCDDVERQTLRDIKHLLESYHYVKSPTFTKRLRDDGQKVFLDSGAFSAYTKGVEIDIREYVRYIHENEDILLVEDGVLLVSVLDAINNPLKTWQNQKKMERLGVQPLPCFHYGEDVRFLKEYVRKYDYITLGGMVPVSSKLLYFWLDDIWDKYLTDSSGNPRIKVHGFGLTAEPLMRRYPWHSVDSSSWVQTGGNGTLLGHSIGGKKIPNLAISAEHPNVKKHNSHYDNFHKDLREFYRVEIESRGYNVEKLRVNWVSRLLYNLQVLNDINKDNEGLQKKFNSVQKGLF